VTTIDRAHCTGYPKLKANIKAYEIELEMQEMDSKKTVAFVDSI